MIEILFIGKTPNNVELIGLVMGIIGFLIVSIDCKKQEKVKVKIDRTF